MLNHNLIAPFSSFSTVDVICLQTLGTVRLWLNFSQYFHRKDMEWSEKHDDVVLCRGSVGNRALPTSV